MQSLKTYFSRGLQYIRTGVPTKVTKVSVAQIQYGGILEGKKVLITGGSRGLGFAIAKRALEEKASVAITGRNMETLKEAKEKLGNPAKLFLYRHFIERIMRFRIRALFPQAHILGKYPFRRLAKYVL